MTKKSGKQQEDPLRRAQRTLVKAQLALHVAQEKRGQAIAKGEAEIERARRRAAQRETRATTRVERRAAAAARAEAALTTLAERRNKEASGSRNAAAEVSARQTDTLPPEGRPLGASPTRAPRTDSSPTRVVGESDGAYTEEGMIVIPEGVEVPVRERDASESDTVKPQ